MQMALRRDEGPRTLSRRLREDNEDAAGLISAATGRGLLVGVAACYGTLNVCLKLVYSFPGAPVAGTGHRDGSRPDGLRLLHPDAGAKRQDQGGDRLGAEGPARLLARRRRARAL